MPKPIANRVLEICPGEFVVQFEVGLKGWTQLGDETFDKYSEALAFEQDKIDSADFGEEE